MSCTNTKCTLFFISLLRYRAGRGYNKQRERIGKRKRWGRGVGHALGRCASHRVQVRCEWIDDAGTLSGWLSLVGVFVGLSR
jgi:hypothetical protein